MAEKDYIAMWYHARKPYGIKTGWQSQMRQSFEAKQRWACQYR